MTSNFKFFLEKCQIYWHHLLGWFSGVKVLGQGTSVLPVDKQEDVCAQPFRVYWPARNSSVYGIPVLFYGKPGSEAYGAALDLSTKASRWTDGCPKEPWTEMTQVLPLSQPESMERAQHCWRDLLFGANTQDLITWPTLEKDGTHCGTKRSPMRPRPSEQNYKLSLSICKSISALHPQDSSLRFFSPPCSPDMSTETMCNFFQLSAPPSKSKAPP